MSSDAIARLNNALARFGRGLIALIRAGRWAPDEDIVFLHTGGAPALFAYRHLFDPE